MLSSTTVFMHILKNGRPMHGSIAEFALLSCPLTFTCLVCLTVYEHDARSLIIVIITATCLSLLKDQISHFI